MLIYRIFNWVSFGILLLCLAAIFFLNASVWLIAMVAFAYVFVLFLGTVRIQMRFFLPSIVSGDKKLKQVALTFDDGPNEHSLAVASCLERHQVKGTFFLIGHKVSEHPDIVKQLDAAGHLVGNHGYFHQWYFPLKFPAKMRAEIQQTNSAIKSVLGKAPNWFRAPFGLTNPWVAKAVRQSDMRSVAWSVRSYDTVLGAGNLLSMTIKQKVHNGAIILLHESGNGMVGFLDAFIPWLKSSGYQIVSLEELINEKAYR
jgi:peptidoglycan/xylan/chitin deacetylase (PgdA/CDA1 family)